MLIPRSTPIDLEALAYACNSFISLSYVPVEPGGSILDPAFEDEVLYAIEGFADWVYDRHDQEPAIRYALAWLLNLDDLRFARAYAAMKVSFAPHSELPTIRKFFELLWGGTFADWRDPRFDPDAHQVKGLPSE